MAGWNDHQKKIVEAVIADWVFMANHELLEWYFSGRPYAQPTRKQVIVDRHRFNGDCTGTMKLINCDWHGIKSFDGEPLGYGNTATFSKAPRGYRRPMNPEKWQPLDIILYKHHSGSFVGGSGEHATQLLYKDKGVWQVGSMGSDSGPKIEDWNYRNDAALVLRIPIPAK